MCLYDEIDKIKILDEPLKEREKALFDYLGLPYTEITQPEVRTALHKLALSHTPVMTGFKYKPFSDPNDWNGQKGYVLYLRVKLEKLILEKMKRDNPRKATKEIKDNLRQAVMDVGNKYEYEQDGLYSIYQRINKNNRDVQDIKKWCESEQCTIDALENILIYY
jgi:hypothetical protein